MAPGELQALCSPHALLHTPSGSCSSFTTLARARGGRVRNRTGLLLVRMTAGRKNGLRPPRAPRGVLLSLGIRLLRSRPPRCRMRVTNMGSMPAGRRNKCRCTWPWPGTRTSPLLYKPKVFKRSGRVSTWASG